MRWAILAIILLTAVFFFIYWFYPLPGDWNDILLNFSFTFASALTTFLVILVCGRFDREEPLRRVWMFLTLGFSCWTLAEAIWAILALFIEVPDISIADVPWVASYAFFVVAFIQQFRLIGNPSASSERKWLLIALFVGLIGPMLATQVTRAVWNTDQSWFETYLLLFYVFADFLLALTAYMIARTFGRGLFRHAYVGLLALGISDFLYSVLLTTGLYAQSAKSGSMLSMFADGLYFDAYLITALGILAHYCLLRFGPSPSAATELRLNSA